MAGAVLIATGATAAILELPPAAIPLDAATPVAKATPTTVRSSTTVKRRTLICHRDPTEESGNAGALPGAPPWRRRPNFLLVTSTGGTGPLG